MRIIAICTGLVSMVALVGSATADVPVSQMGAWTTGLSHAAGPGSDRLLLFTAGWEEMQAGADRPIASVDYGGRQSAT